MHSCAPVLTLKSTIAEMASAMAHDASWSGFGAILGDQRAQFAAIGMHAISDMMHPAKVKALRIPDKEKMLQVYALFLEEKGLVPVCRTLTHESTIPDMVAVLEAHPRLQRLKNTFKQDRLDNRLGHIGIHTIGELLERKDEARRVMKDAQGMGEVSIRDFFAFLSEAGVPTHTSIPQR